MRKWYGHDPEKFPEFRRRYIAELTQPWPQAALGQLRTLAAAGPVALLTATRDVDRSNAAVLAEILCQDSPRSSRLSQRVSATFSAPVAAASPKTS